MAEARYRRPASEEIRFISSGVSEKSNIAKFSAMRSGFEERGMAIFIGCWICQRSTICAGVFRFAFAISRRPSPVTTG